MTRTNALTFIAITLLGIFTIMMINMNNSPKSAVDQFADGVNNFTDSITGKTPAEKIGDSVNDVVDEVKH